MGMRKKLHALFGRKNETGKIKATLNLGVSRLSVLKNQRQARLNVVRDDVLQLLNLGQHERALLRVEQVIKDQNMLDAFVMMESYLHQLIERINLIESEKTCPEELNEATSSLIYAGTRCGEFPELQEIRILFASRFGKEFAARAVELRNNCGVNHKMIQKLSTKMPSLESRMKVLKAIASENNIILQLEELESERTEEQKGTDSGLGQPMPRTPSHSGDLKKLEGCPDSVDVRANYKDVAAAAQAAFESAAFAAAAARAAVQLSRSDSHDPDDSNSPKLQPAVSSLNPDAEKTKSLTVGKRDFRGVEAQKVEMEFEKIHPMQKYDVSESEEEEMVKAEQFKRGKNEGEFKRSFSSSSSDSFDDNIVNETETFSHNELLRKLEEKDIVFFESDDESHGMSRINLTETKQILLGKKVLGSEIPYSMEGDAAEQSYRRHYSPSHKQFPSRSQAGFKMEQAPEKFRTAGVRDLQQVEKMQSSVRTKRTYGR